MPMKTDETRERQDVQKRLDEMVLKSYEKFWPAPTECAGLEQMEKRKSVGTQVTQVHLKNGQ